MCPFYLFQRCIYVLFLFCFESNECSLYDEHPNNIPKIQKCCGPDEQLTSDLVCAPMNSDRTKYHYDYGKRIANVTEYPWWLKNDIFLSAEDLQPITFGTNNFTENFSIDFGKIPCRLENDADLKLFVDDDSLYIFDNGSLLILERGTNKTVPVDGYCVDKLAGSGNLVPVYVAFVCPCHFLKCFRKCCFSDFVLTYSEPDDHWICTTAGNISWKSHLWKFEKEGDFYQIHKFPVCRKESHYFTVNEEEFVDIPADFNILNDGSLEYNGYRYPEHSYCGEITVYKSGKSIPNILTCGKIGVPLTYKNIIYGSLYFFGSVFLFCSLSVHVAFPEMRRKVHAYNLMAHVSCLLVGYVVHCFLTLGTSLIRDTLVCHLAGYGLCQQTLTRSHADCNYLCKQTLRCLHQHRLTPD